jgi:hypothetical protein
MMANNGIMNRRHDVPSGNLLFRLTGNKKGNTQAPMRRSPEIFPESVKYPPQSQARASAKQRHIESSQRSSEDCRGTGACSAMSCRRTLLAIGGNDLIVCQRGQRPRAETLCPCSLLRVIGSLTWFTKKIRVHSKQRGRR